MPSKKVWNVYVPPPATEPEATPPPPIDDDQAARRNLSAETYPERVAASRSFWQPVVDAEWEAERAKREKRTARIIRCECGRNVYVDRGCWHCLTLGAIAYPITHDVRTGRPYVPLPGAPTLVARRRFVAD